MTEAEIIEAKRAYRFSLEPSHERRCYSCQYVKPNPRTVFQYECGALGIIIGNRTASACPLYTRRLQPAEAVEEA